ncbi:hypothetical protein CEXT_811061 [Caerostris extrusa]|uniref:Uncharacterized protein n=1 Tax=Caerostris extrusa TaxID=172846 RepID=A0AAV4T7Q8_CAEEX|nr:hypothetical protein CEXT_811061 [Caerostris extrusa]
MVTFIVRVPLGCKSPKTIHLLLSVCQRHIRRRRSAEMPAERETEPFSDSSRGVKGLVDLGGPHRNKRGLTSLLTGLRLVELVDAFTNNNETS